MTMLPETTSDVHAQIHRDEVGIGELPTLSGAAKLVIGDFEKAESWLSGKQWALRWRECQLRYDPVRITQMWEGTSVPRSSLNVYSVSQIVQSLLSKVVEGIFSDDPPFIIQPRKGTGAEVARAISAILNFQIQDCDFQQEIEDGAADAILFGTAIWKVNWREYEVVSRDYKRSQQPLKLDPLIPGGEEEFLHTEESDDIVFTTKKSIHGMPVIEQQDLYTTYVDPACRRTDIRKAKWVISKLDVSAAELDEMRNWEGFNIPSNAKLMDVLFPNRAETAMPTQLESMENTGNNNINHQAQPRFVENTVDPTEDTSRFEILERWDNGKVVAILNRRLVIRDEENPFGRLPYLSLGWWRVPNAFYSLGVGITSGDEQEIQRGLINSMLDEVSWNTNLPILVAEGEQLLTQNIRMALGKFVKVKDPANIQQMKRTQAIPEAYAEIQASQARSEGSSGANELLVQGSMPSQGRTSLGRTATGANLLAGGSGSRLELFVNRLARQVFVPALELFFEMDKQFLEMDELRDILDDELFNAYEGDHLDILKAKVKFEVLAASQMVARQGMAQTLPIMSQTFLTDPMHSMLQAQGKKVDVNELANMFFDIARWKNKASLIVDMTPEDQQRSAASNPMVQKMMADRAHIQAQTQSRLSIDDADNAARAYKEVLRQTLEKNLTPDAVTGNPVGGENALGNESFVAQ